MLGRGPISFFEHEYPIVLTLFIEKSILPPSDLQSHLFHILSVRIFLVLFLDFVHSTAKNEKVSSVFP